ncbi:peptidylprolyl isomerase SurA [secondary endosymbiont of Ctenarytaina eucalypti]|uniref:Chaperone SurA n=1 Tax=secondary endosymbiont of Ctenarytaina eucalypti TaxID=1199245 RepID=J3VSM5_9ENTR|nr:peptidylprolyl isomerase SurA [secondary endosymbiont of Ctenarytaina eucalypti]AFP84941.1 parvulin-like peptidyl-prolyl isomerase [secondary endosymbiont of Ctenarytaina eucalypti]
MKKWSAFIIFLGLFTIPSFASPEVVDKVAAVLENGVVLESDVNSILTALKSSIQETKQKLPDDTSMRRQILNQLIIDNILLQLAQRANLSISEQQLDQAIGNILSQNHMTLNQLHNRLEHSGINYKTYRENIRKEMLISEVRNSEVRSRVTISPQEIDELAHQLAAQAANRTEFNLSHILVPLPEKTTRDQLHQAAAIANALVEKSKYVDDLVKYAITDPENQRLMKGSKIEWAKLEELPSLFVTPLQDAQKGDIIGPIRSGVGFHILKVTDIRGGDNKVAVTEVHARHILLRTSVLISDQEARGKLEDIAANIKNGRIKFSVAAKQLSEDPGSSNQGGDLGWISASAFDPLFRNALMQLKKGEISMPVHSSFGWHLIQLIDIRQVDCTDAARKDRAYQLLLNRKFSDEVQPWLQERRVSAYVKIINN